MAYKKGMHRLGFAVSEKDYCTLRDYMRVNHIVNESVALTKLIQQSNTKCVTLDANIFENMLVDLKNAKYALTCALKELELFNDVDGIEK